MIIKKRCTHNYTVIDNNIINNKTISWRSKGILIYLLSKPENWNTNVSDIVRCGNDGRAAVSGSIAELEKYGYIEKEPRRMPDGKVAGWEYYVTDCPKSAVLPLSAEPLSVNPPLLSTEEDSKYYNILGGGEKQQTAKPAEKPKVGPEIWDTCHSDSQRWMTFYVKRYMPDLYKNATREMVAAHYKSYSAMFNDMLKSAGSLDRACRAILLAEEHFKGYNWGLKALKTNWSEFVSMAIAKEAK